MPVELSAGERADQEHPVQEHVVQENAVEDHPEEQHDVGGERQDRDTKWRFAAERGLWTLLPTAVLTWVPVLLSTRFASCLTNGEPCTPGAGPVAWYAFWGSAVAGGVALLPFTVRTVKFLRPVATSAQFALLILMATAILSQA